MSTPPSDFTPEPEDPLADSPPPPPDQLAAPPPPRSGQFAVPPTPPGGHSQVPPSPFAARSGQAPPAGGGGQQYGAQGQYGAPGPYAAPPGVPYGAAPYGYAPRPSYPKTWMNIVALVTGLMCFGVVAVIFGHLGVNAANRGEAEHKGMGAAGLILGYVGVVFYVIYFGAIFGSLALGY